tara:strand:- start:584 stop:841 length:258 start_codon:yes stop_codon:yes gene_type:complete
LSSLKNLNDRYTNFFDAPGGEDDKGGGNGFSDRYGWWSLVDSLSNSRVDKWAIILEWDVTYGLNICSYYKEKQREEKKQLQKVGR